MKESLLDKVDFISRTYLGDERHIDLFTWLVKVIPEVLAAMKEAYGMSSAFSVDHPELDNQEAKKKWNELLHSICFQFDEGQDAFEDSNLIAKYASAQKEYLEEHGTLNGFEEDEKYREVAAEGKGELEATMGFNAMCLKRAFQLIIDNLDYLSCDMDV